MRAELPLLLGILATALPAAPLDLPWGPGAGQVSYWNETSPDYDELEPCGPESITLDAGGRRYVADTQAHRILIFAPDGRLESAIHHPEIQFPGVMAVTPRNTLLVVLDSGGAVAELRRDGTLVSTHGDANFQQIGALASDSRGRLYVADEGLGRIVVLDEADQILAEIPWQLTGMALTPAGEILDLAHEPGQGYAVRARDLAGASRILFRLPGSKLEGGRLIGVRPDGAVWVRFLLPGADRTMDLVLYDRQGNVRDRVRGVPLLTTSATVAVGPRGELHWLDYDAETAPAGSCRLRAHDLD